MARFANEEVVGFSIDYLVRMYAEAVSQSTADSITGKTVQKGHGTDEQILGDEIRRRLHEGVNDKRALEGAKLALRREHQNHINIMQGGVAE